MDKTKLLQEVFVNSVEKKPVAVLESMNELIVDRVRDILAERKEIVKNELFLTDDEKLKEETDESEDETSFPEEYDEEDNNDPEENEKEYE